MSNHIAKSGKNIDSSKSHLVPTSVRKATTFLNDEYLRTCQQRAIILVSICAVSAITALEKNHPPHNLKVAVWIFRVEVKNASCSCVACQVGFCNHFLALLLKLCKFSLYECESVTDLENEDNMQPKRICTSTLQQWHRKGRGDCINPQPVMEVLVTKTSLELDKQSSSRGSGLKCLLYEARNSLKGQQASESKSLERLRELNPKMALSHIMTARTESTTLVLTKFGKSPQGSFASYQLSVTIQRATFWDLV